MVVKTKEEARANFENSITYIPDRYSKGVQKADWLTPAKSEQAEKNYAAGVTAAVGAKSRQKAISSMSNDDWKNAAINKGAPIIGERIRGSMDKWSANFGARYDRIVTKVATLPPKTTDPIANVNNRLIPIVKEWRAAAGRS